MSSEHTSWTAPLKSLSSDLTDTLLAKENKQLVLALLGLCRVAVSISESL